jgi:hypothetical protein
MEPAHAQMLLELAHGLAHGLRRRALRGSRAVETAEFGRSDESRDRAKFVHMGRLTAHRGRAWLR